MSRPLYITRPLLPDLQDVRAMLEQIWSSKNVTNGGPLHQALEQELERYLGVPCAMLFNNGTIGLLVALKLMDLPQGSEVITTPLTFAATAHAIAWNGLRPVFADVDPETLTLDTASVQQAITDRTSAILPVHVYGTVCDVHGLQQIADEHGLRLIFDAAHVFGATVDGKGIGAFGDASVFSFHATKLFNTLEGGLITTPNTVDRENIYFLRNFGIKNEDEVVSIGINGKMNEFQAGIGLLNLNIVGEERRRRSLLRQQYSEILKHLPGVALPPTQPGVVGSEQYYRVVIDPKQLGASRDDIYDRLKAKGIYCRKYFHPICTDFGPYRGYPIITAREAPYADVVKSQVLCLPFHSGVDEIDIEEICAEFLRPQLGGRATSGRASASAH